MRSIRQYPSSLKRIRDLIAICSQPEFVRSDLLRSALASHICVLQSGALEYAIKETISEFIDTRAHPEVARFSKAKIAEIQNANPEKIEQYIGLFNSEKTERLKALWADGEIRDHISSIIANRHRIAHGQNTTVTLHTVQSWQRSVERFVAFLEDEFR